jgi:ubiquinone/menaquinone biosynthesis C-methylase UbiE
LKLEEYERMYHLEDHYWWFVGRRYALIKLLKRYAGDHSVSTLLDVGCGTGATLQYLKRRSNFKSLRGLEPSEEAMKFCKKRGLDDITEGQAEDVPFSEETFDVVTAMDVIEHVDDDRKALSEFVRVCKTGGKVVIFVPAYKFLWSEHDEALHHRRRYTARELQEKMREAGLKIEKSTYLITFLCLPIIVFRFLQKFFRRHPKEPKTDLIEIPKWTNKLLAGLINIETLLTRFISLPFGVTVICVGRKVKVD